MTLSPVLRIIRNKKYKRFLISSHVRPDVDALCSELAVAALIRAMGKAAVIVNDDQSQVMYDFLPGIRSIRTYEGRHIRFDAAVIVDCGDFDRIGTVKELVMGKPVVNIDHHITNDYFGTVNAVDAGASSTAEIIYQLFKSAGVPLNRRLAVLLYLGIMTDTGSFRYASTTARAHQVVAQLMKFDLPVQDLYKQIYERIPLDNLRLFTRLVNMFEICLGGKAAVVELYKRDIDRFSGSFDLRDKIFSFLRAIEGVEVIAILTQEKKKRTRVNLRSQQKVDVSRLAAYFGGGGHKRASGCTIAADMKAAKKELLRQLRKVV